MLSEKAAQRWHYKQRTMSTAQHYDVYEIQHQHYHALVAYYTPTSSLNATNQRKFNNQNPLRMISMQLFHLALIGPTAFSYPLRCYHPYATASRKALPFSCISPMRGGNESHRAQIESLHHLLSASELRFVLSYS